MHHEYSVREPSAAGGPAGPPLAFEQRRAASVAELAREVSNPLGVYLKARREQVTPEQVGLTVTGARRVPGLRREEVASLAGISFDYYLRLERGRDRSPSAQVLDAIARVLMLDDDNSAHLRSLVASPRDRGQRGREELVPHGSLKLLDSLALPAFIEGRYLDILASNSLVKAVSPRLATGRNQLRDLFLNQAERALQADWGAVTECLVASLRQSAGGVADDPRLVELVANLSQASPRFAELWSRHDVRGQRGAALRIVHPQVGEMTLNRERFVISGAEDMALVVLHADAGSTDAERLAQLASTRIVRGVESLASDSTSPMWAEVQPSSADAVLE